MMLASDNVIILQLKYSTTGPTEPQVWNKNKQHICRQRAVSISLFRRFLKLIGRLHPLWPCWILISLCHHDIQERDTKYRPFQSKSGLGTTDTSWSVYFFPYLVVLFCVLFDVVWLCSCFLLYVMFGDGRS